MAAMTTEPKKGLERLDEMFVEDILEASDADIVAEFVDRGGNVAKNTADTRTLFERAILLVNKKRMGAARSALARNTASGPIKTAIDIAEARRRLRNILAHAKDEKLTLAARKESELSDADVLGMLEDYEDLAATTRTDGEGGDQ
jgi:hypothetical protein